MFLRDEIKHASVYKPLKLALRRMPIGRRQYAESIARIYASVFNYVINNSAFVSIKRKSYGLAECFVGLAVE